MDQLDGLRGLAVLAVLFAHLAPPEYLCGVAWGRLGVILFFVLSGFLITGILLRLRGSLERGEQTLRECLMTFYVRRALRIFPLYYATLAVCWVVDMPDVRQDFWWLASYLSNYYAPDPPHGNRHLWSLGVEEQFYLVWPWVVLLLPRRRLRPTLVFGVIFAAVYQGWNLFYLHRDAGYYTACNLDSLGLGAWLAVVAEELTPEQISSTTSQWLGWGGAATLGLQLVVWSGYDSHVVLSMQRFTSCFVFGYFVWHASRGFVGRVGAVLDAPLLRYIGRRSYGIYILHPYVYAVYPGIWMRIRLHYHLGTFFTIPGLPAFVVLVLISIAAAEMSWRCLEGPANRLKRLFPYG